MTKNNSHGHNSKRSILKQMLSGNLTPAKAGAELQKAVRGTSSNVVIYGPGGLFAVGGEKALTEQQMLERVAGAGVVYYLPDNGR